MLSPSPAPSPPVQPDLLAFLASLPLAAFVFTHAELADSDDTLLPEPTWRNEAAEQLLRQGKGPSRARASGPHRPGDGAEEATEQDEQLAQCMDERTRKELRRWLVQGAALFSSSSLPASSSAPGAPIPSRNPTPTSSCTSARPDFLHSPSSRRPPPSRSLSVKLLDRISWPPVRFSASVHAEYTVLTQLPWTAGALGLNAPLAEAEEKWEGEGADAEKKGQANGERVNENGRPVERMGDIEVEAERVLRADTIEGMAYTLWNCPLAVFRLNRDFSIVQVTPRWRELTGVPPDEDTDAWASRIHPDDLQGVMDHYARFREEEVNEIDEFEFRWKSTFDEKGVEGEDQWCSAVVRPLRIQGRIEGYTAYMLNINRFKALDTDAPQRERELRDELAVLSDTCQVGLSRHATDGKFLSVNKAWRDITRVTEEEDLEGWREEVHPDDRERVIRAWQNAIDTRTSLSIQYRWRHGDVVLVQVQPIYAEADKVTGWIGSVTNVTAQAEAEQKVLNLLKEREARAKKEAEEAEERRKVAVAEKKQQELLIDVTSHEIRNPISAILQNSDFTRSSLQSLRSLLLSLKEKNALPQELDGKLLADLDEDIEALDSITECGLAQERIANDILGLAQIQLSKYSITPVEFDLATSLRNICRMFKSECRSKGIELKLVIGSSLARLGSRARVFADPARLTQVLVNLLSNAIRFTAKSAVRQVTLAVEVSSAPIIPDAPLVPPEETEYHIESKRPIYLFFSVEDTGPGMTEEETGRLFAKFTQASPFTHTTWGGSGLGLWIARNLCELQAGRIEVASTVGKGSIFRCFITAQSVDAGPSERSDEALPVVEGITAPNAHRGQMPKVFLAKPGEAGASLSGMKILCCEDNQINRTVLKRQLEKEGCEDVLLACDGQEGLDILNQQQPGDIDCILMDIEMPIMDGLAATRAIRLSEQQGQRRGHQRVVGLTGNARQAQRQAAIEAGMDTVVTKPYKIPDLIEKISGGPDSSTAPPSPALVAMRSPSQSTFKEGTHLSPTSKEVNEPVLETSKATSVVTITGRDDDAERKDVKTVRNSVERHGQGTTLPPSHDTRQLGR
ncbi:hypothetical protein JCM10213v2_002855 [Rhodosporidiobolus nylandii]